MQQLKRVNLHQPHKCASVLRLLTLLLLATTLPSAYSSKHKSEHHKKHHTSSKNKHSKEENEHKHDDTKHPSTVVLLMQVQERSKSEEHNSHLSSEQYGEKEYLTPYLKGKLSKQAERLLSGQLTEMSEVSIAADDSHHYKGEDEADDKQQIHTLKLDVSAVDEEEHRVSKALPDASKKGTNSRSSKLTLYSIADVRGNGNDEVSNSDNVEDTISDDDSDTEEDTSFALREGSALWDVLHQIRANTNMTSTIDGSNGTSPAASKDTKRRKRWVKFCYITAAVVAFISVEGCI